MTDQPTMRERLAHAAEAAADYDSEVGDDSSYRYVANWPQIVDAILAEIEKPSRSIVQAGENVELGGTAAFTAMIQAIREGK